MFALGLFFITTTFAAEFTVEIRNNFFSPANLTIDAGDTVTWIQRGFNHNTESYDPPGVWTSQLLQLGETFSFTFNQPGTYRYLCRPHASGMRGTIIVRPKANAPPTVNITAPADGTEISAGTALTITASANDTDGTIARVEFFAGNTLLGEDTTSPYSVTADLAPGTHRITAKATDNAGASSTSAAVSVSVLEAVIPIVLSDARRLADGRFQFRVSGASGRTYAIQVSTDLKDWREIGRVTPASVPFEFVDPESAGPNSSGYYRVIMP